MKTHSEKIVSAYIYSNAGKGESTTDCVFSGHSIICENGEILAENPPFNSGLIFADVDLDAIDYNRNKVFNQNFGIEKKEYLNKWLSRYGFNNDIDVVLNDNNEVLEEIEKEKVVEVPVVAPRKEVITETKTEDKKYFRPKKDTNVTPIKDLLYEVDNVTIEGMIFGIDMFEAKSGYKIITLKVTDNNDSIYVKMFTKDNEEYARIKDLLKNGCWYNFYGKVQMDKYANELTFTTRYKDVEKIEAPTVEKIEDNEEVKRVELHAHTMMSQMDGITGVDLGKHTCELVSKCIDMGYKGVAITDHSGCQAFPIAFGIINSYNKKQEDMAGYPVNLFVLSSYESYFQNKEEIYSRRIQLEENLLTFMNQTLQK